MASSSLPLQMLMTGHSFNSIAGRSLPVDLAQAEEKPLLAEAHSINIYSASETYNELPYKLGQIEGKGEGVIATRDLAPGDYIASEKAKLRWHVTEESFYRLEWMLSKLSEEDRAKYYRLYNCYTREAFGCPDEQLPPDIIGKWKTNCFGIEADYQIVLLDVITKINHACRENVTRYYCAKTETMTVVACDYIEKGQELVQSYMDILQDCNYRRYNAILAWGFLCMCDVCDQSPADLQVSDKRRVRIARIRDVELPKQKDRPEQCIELLKEALTLCIAERLYSVLHALSIECVKLYAELDLEEEVSAWAAITAEHLRIARGENDETVRFMQRCVRQPWLYRRHMLEGDGWIRRAYRLAVNFMRGIH